MSVKDFIGAALSQDLHYDFPVGWPATVAINTGQMSCWDCGADTVIVSSIAVTYGPHEIRLVVAEFENAPELLALVRERIPPNAGLGIIRPRFSRTREMSYLSNGCAHCDALIGKHYEHEAWYGEKPISTFEIIVDESWRELLIPRAHERWGIYLRT